MTNEWDVFDSLYYNAWLEVEILPTRFIDPDIIRQMGIRDDLEEMLRQAELGTLASRPQDLYPSLVRQFMATVRFGYRQSGVASTGVLSFFARGVRYNVTVPELCSIYGFEQSSVATSVTTFTGVRQFWEIIATGAWSTATAIQSDIRHPTLRYFLRVLASTLLCKMEPNKVRIHELAVLFLALDGLVDLTHLDPDHELPAPNMAAVFAEHLVSLKMKPFSGGSSVKKETVGSLLTPIFTFCGIRLDAADANTSRMYLDEAHLRNSGWIDRQLQWTFRTAEGPQRITLPRRRLTDLDSSIDRLRFQPSRQILTRPPSQRRSTGARSSSASQASSASLPPFPDLAGLETGEERVYRRGVLSALRAIWSRVSRCRCSSRASTSAMDPAAAGPSQQGGADDDEESSDDESSEE